MFPARARTRTARSGDERTNHDLPRLHKLLLMFLQIDANEKKMVAINFRKHWRKKRNPLIYLDDQNSNSLCSPHHNVNSFSCSVSLSSSRSTAFSDRVLTERIVIVALCRLLLDRKLLIKSCFSNSFTYCFYTVKKNDIIQYVDNIHQFIAFFLSQSLIIKYLAFCNKNVFGNHT